MLKLSKRSLLATVLATTVVASGVLLAFGSEEATSSEGVGVPLKERFSMGRAFGKMKKAFGTERGLGIFAEDLSDEQKEELKTMQEEHKAQMDALREEHRSEMLGKVAEYKGVTVEELQEQIDEHRQEMNEERKLRFQEMKENFQERKDNLKERFGNKGRGGRRGMPQTNVDGLDISEEPENLVEQ